MKVIVADCTTQNRTLVGVSSSPQYIHFDRRFKKFRKMNNMMYSWHNTTVIACFGKLKYYLQLEVLMYSTISSFVVSFNLSRSLLCNPQMASIRTH